MVDSNRTAVYARAFVLGMGIFGPFSALRNSVKDDPFAFRGAEYSNVQTHPMISNDGDCGKRLDTIPARLTQSATQGRTFYSGTLGM